MKLVFWISIFILIHSYLLYPGIIKIISLFFKQKKYENEPPFTISILISAYNEEKVIRERLSNIAGLDYDLTKVEVLVGSDCSSDKTDELLLELKKEYPISLDFFETIKKILNRKILIELILIFGILSLFSLIIPFMKTPNNTTNTSRHCEEVRRSNPPPSLNANRLPHSAPLRSQ